MSYFRELANRAPEYKSYTKKTTVHYRQLFPKSDNKIPFQILRAFADSQKIVWHNRRWIDKDGENLKTALGLYSRRNIFVAQLRNPIERAETLAHELAHYFHDCLLCGIIRFENEWFLEQVAMLVSTRIMADLGIDIAAPNLALMWAYRKNDKKILLRGVDKAAEDVYTLFSRELQYFLKKE